MCVPPDLFRRLRVREWPPSAGLSNARFRVRESRRPRSGRLHVLPHRGIADGIAPIDQTFLGEPDTFASAAMT